MVSTHLYCKFKLKASQTLLISGQNTEKFLLRNDTDKAKWRLCFYIQGILVIFQTGW